MNLIHKGRPVEVSDYEHGREGCLIKQAYYLDCGDEYPLLTDEELDSLQEEVTRWGVWHLSCARRYSYAAKLNADKRFPRLATRAELAAGDL